MNAAHLHITLVHFPVVLVPVAVLTLFIGARLKDRSVEVVGLTILVLAALIALPGFLLGEGAEELVEHLPGISEHTIEEHEEAATIAFWLSTAVGILSVVTLLGLWRLAAWSRVMSCLVMLAGVFASASLLYAAFEGGKIRHPEAYPAQHGESAVSQEHEAPR